MQNVVENKVAGDVTVEIKCEDSLRRREVSTKVCKEGEVANGDQT